VDPNQTPAEVAVREVEEETGVRTSVVSDPLFAHPAVTVHAAPYAVLEMDVRDSKVGEHRHVDTVYVLRAVSGELTAQMEEVSGVRWAPIADVAGLDTPAELPALVTDAARWAKTRW
jgi:8-oxo-dGTP diphosphatase